MVIHTFTTNQRNCGQTWTSPKTFPQGAGKQYNRTSRACERDKYRTLNTFKEEKQYGLALETRPAGFLLRPAQAKCPTLATLIVRVARHHRVTRSSLEVQQKMPTCPSCKSVNVDYEDTPPNRQCVGIIIYHCRDCGLTEKEETGKAYTIKEKIGQSTFQQRIDTHYRVDDLLRKKWNNPRV
jgi:ribosomal protein L37AE/L43A